MTAVIVQPCGPGDPTVRYNNTVAKPVVFSDHAAEIPTADLSRLNELFPGGSAPMWGVVPGKRNVNVGRYRRIQVGDLVMFSGQSRFYACGTVAYLMRNAKLAVALWGYRDDGQTWEYMYVLDEIRPLDVPYAEFNAVVADKPNNPHQGFRPLDEQKSRALLQHLLLASERHVPPISEKQYEDAAAALTGHLDRKIEAIQRTEQAYLRRKLWFAPASLEAAMSANCSLAYQFPAPDNRFPRTFSVAYRRYMSGSGPRYTTAPSPLLRASRHRLPASPSSGR